MRIQPPKGRKKKQGNWFQHDFAFMRKVANDYINGIDSAKEVATRYGITRSKVTGWAHRYRTGQEPFNEVSLAIMSGTRLFVSSVTLYELHIGANSDEKRNDVKKLTRNVIILPFDKDVAHRRP